ncbi:MAG TPA: phosphatase PAP2 family protein, partial [Gaiellales bacterium]|nr:phosphatase PAP2 family protein [Gaiellales bacterium]
ARSALHHWWGRRPDAALAEGLAQRSRIRRFVDSRLDAQVLTGLALTLALALITAAGVVVSVLALAVRQVDAVADADSWAARWAADHGSGFSHRALEGVSLLASTEGVIVIGLVVAIVEMMRLPSRWIPVFLIVVAAGDSLVTTTIKELVDRARPAIDPAAAALGPSFPSGHSSTAAAFYAGLALLAGRRRPDRTKAVLAGCAVGIAVAVASSRVLLDLHWLSDVVGGLMLGWGWFALCAIAFGGWILELGAPAEKAAADQTPRRQAPAGSVRS